MQKTLSATVDHIELNRERQTLAVLWRMIQNGGVISAAEIYDAVETQQGKLTEQDKKDLLALINTDVLNKEYLISENGEWRITPKGREYADQAQSAENVEEESIVSDDTTDNAITEPYNPDLINVVIKPYPIFQVLRKIKHDSIILQPDFQRHLIWDETRQSRLIESILIRIPLPAFYLDALDETRWLVVDGLQRLSTLDRFCNKNELRLRNLEFLPDLNGKTFQELSLALRTRIEDSHLQFYLIQPDTPPEVKFTIFYRINTGGLVLTAQEIRHSLFQGRSTKLLQKMAESSEFKATTTNSISSKRMDDRECVLRFFAFYLTPYSGYKPSFDHFLSQAMQTINQMGDVRLNKLGVVFKDVMRKATDVFGPYAFRKMYEVDGRRYPINKSLFEVWSVLLSRYSSQDLKRHRDRIVSEFVQLMNQDNSFVKAISQGTGSIANVEKRFGEIEKLLEGIVQ